MDAADPAPFPGREVTGGARSVLVLGLRVWGDIDMVPDWLGKARGGARRSLHRPRFDVLEERRLLATVTGVTFGSVGYVATSTGLTLSADIKVYGYDFNNGTVISVNGLDWITTGPLPANGQQQLNGEIAPGKVANALHAGDNSVVVDTGFHISNIFTAALTPPSSKFSITTIPTTPTAGSLVTVILSGVYHSPDTDILISSDRERGGVR